MPVLDGWSLLRDCRTDAILADVPVIVMSARLDAHQAAAAAGARACLIKPFDVDVLLRVLDETFRTTRDCAVCASSGAAHELPVFVAGSHPATWWLCGGCWNLLEAGFARSHQGDALDAYVRRPGFNITETEVKGYVRLGLAGVPGGPA